MSKEDFTPPVKTRRVSRANLAKFLPNTELIKQFEDMVADVATVLPDATNTVAQVADGANTAANQALSIAAGARNDIGRLTSALAENSTLLRLQRDPRAELQRMQARIAELENNVVALQRATNTDTLRRQIDELRTLVMGA